MSRVGKLPIKVPSGVNINIDGKKIKATGPKGNLDLVLQDFVNAEMVDDTIKVSVNDENISMQKAGWGLSRTLINNMVLGVSEGYQKSLEILGVGYKFEIVGTGKLILSIGFSHKVEVLCPEGVVVTADTETKNTIHIKGIDKQKVGFFAAKLRSMKKPEPYKGKGIRYSGERVRKKAGKTGAKK